MSSRLLRVTAEAAVISAVSNTLAQGLTVYRKGALSAIDPVTFFHFIILAIITTPPNYQWQLALEKNFPSNGKKEKDITALKKKDDDAVVDEKKEKEALSISNTMAKFLLDQSVGAILNTVFFIVMINLLRGATWSQTLTAVQRDSLPNLLAGWKFWPFVTILNLVVIPVEQRMLVGNLAGLAWGVYFSLMNM